MNSLERVGLFAYKQLLETERYIYIYTEREREREREREKRERERERKADQQADKQTDIR